MDTVGNPRSKCMGDGSCRRRTPGHRRRTQCGDVRSACRSCAAHGRSPSFHKSCLPLEGRLTGVSHRTDHGVPDTRAPYIETPEETWLIMSCEAASARLYRAG